MSESCTALATKSELEVVKGLIDEKLDKNKEPQIIQASVGLAVPAAAALLLPEIDAVLARLAALAGRVGELFAKFASVFSVLATVATLVELGRLEYEVSKMRSEVNSVKGIAESAVSRSDKAIRDANEAYQKASVATIDAGNAERKAVRSLDRANLAMTTANAIKIDPDIVTKLIKIQATIPMTVIKESDEIRIKATDLYTATSLGGG
jgi:hypothetical protein